MEEFRRNRIVSKPMSRRFSKIYLCFRDRTPQTAYQALFKLGLKLIHGIFSRPWQAKLGKNTSGV